MSRKSEYGTAIQCKSSTSEFKGCFHVMMNVCRGQPVTATQASAVTLPSSGYSSTHPGSGEPNSGDDSRDATTMEDEEYTDSSSVSSGSGDAIVAEPCIPMSEDEVMQIR